MESFTNQRQRENAGTQSFKPTAIKILRSTSVPVIPPLEVSYYSLYPVCVVEQ